MGPQELRLFHGAIAIGMLLMGPTHAIASDRPCDWITKRAVFHIARVLNANTGVEEYAADPNPEKEKTGAVSEFIFVNRIASGTLVTRQECVNSEMNQHHSREIRIPLRMDISMTGINPHWHVGLYPSTTIELMNLDGKTLRDLTEHKFRGIKAGVYLAFILGLNPNASIVANSKWIWMADLDKWLTAGLGLGLKLTGVSVKFSPLKGQHGGSSQFIDVQGGPTTQKTTTKTNLTPEEAADFRF